MGIKCGLTFALPPHEPTARPASALLPQSLAFKKNKRWFFDAWVATEALSIRVCSPPVLPALDGGMQRSRTAFRPVVRTGR